jgi:hypothetical protein
MTGYEQSPDYGGSGLETIRCFDCLTQRKIVEILTCTCNKKAVFP